MAVGFSPDTSVAYLLAYSQILTMSITGGPTTVLAGQTNFGFADGTGAQAQFFGATSLTVHPLGVIYITDFFNHRIRACTPLGVVSTFAGSGIQGQLDGAALIAQFNNPSGIVLDLAGTNIFVSCFGANTLRQVVVATGWTTTLAGSGLAAVTNGVGLAAAFNHPTYI